MTEFSPPPHARQLVTALRVHESLERSAALIFLEEHILPLAVQTRQHYWVADFTSKDLAEIAGVSDRTVDRHVTALVNEELVALTFEAHKWGKSMHLDMSKYLPSLHTPQTIGVTEGVTIGVTLQNEGGDNRGVKGGDTLARTHTRDVEHRPAVPVPPLGGTGTEKEQRTNDAREVVPEKQYAAPPTQSQEQINRRDDLIAMKLDHVDDLAGIEGVLPTMLDLLQLAIPDAVQPDARELCMYLEEHGFTPWQQCKAVKHKLATWMGKNCLPASARAAVSWLKQPRDLEEMKQGKRSRPHAAKVTYVNDPSTRDDSPIDPDFMARIRAQAAAAFAAVADTSDRLTRPPERSARQEVSA